MSDQRIIAVITGTRAEFGLLKPVMRAIKIHNKLELRVLVTGTHLLERESGSRTLDEVAGSFDVHATIPMQEPGESGRFEDAVALGRGISGFGEYFAQHPPDVALVLGDRIEAFAAAAAASVAGIRVAHLHGGDRAEGIADEAIRHAISKLAHIHLPATADSAERLICMGEAVHQVHLVGSPAIDGLQAIGPLNEDEFETLGRPEIVFLLHPSGLESAAEYLMADRLLKLCQSRGRVLALHPNHDSNREQIIEAIEDSGCKYIDHLPRDRFIGLLRRVKCLAGNSSAGLIECAGLGVGCLNLGMRQAGRQMPPNVVDVPDWDLDDTGEGLERILWEPSPPVKHPYGNGQASLKTAEVLASYNEDHHPLIKHNSY